MSSNSFPAAVRMLVGGLIGLLAGLATYLEPIRELEELSIDGRLRVRGKQLIPDEMRLVGIDDDDLRQLGRWPLPRGIHADALRILGAMEAEQVVFDVLIIEPSSEPAQDELLRTAATGLASLTLPYYYQDIGGDGPAHFLEGKRYGVAPAQTGFIRASDPVAPLSGLGTSFGAANVMPDPGNEIIRRVPMMFKTGGRFYPGLAMQALMQLLHAQPDQVRIHPGHMIEIIDTPRGTIRIPIDGQGTYRVNFLGSLEAFRPAFTYTDLYRAVSDSEHAARVTSAIKNHVVVIGDISTGSADMVTTPIGRVPGVAVQATVLSNILSGRHLRLLPQWAIVLVNVALGICFGAAFRMLRLGVGMLTTVGWLAAITGTAVLAAYHDLMLPLTSGLGTIAVASTILTTMQALHFRRAAKRVRDALSPFVDHKVIEHALDDAARSLPTSERRELTILFSDIRGFTRWTEKQEADEVTRTLNEYFAAMVPIVHRFGGTLDKLIGDGMMVFVGAPDEVERHALVAIQIAWAMQQEVARLATRFASEARDRFGIGIGIHSGFVTVGHFGSDEFHNYTVIGRSVNLAARVEGVCPAGRILITQRTLALAGPAVRSRAFGEFRLHGLADPVPLVEVVGVEGMDEATEPPDPAVHYLTGGHRKLGPFPAAGIRLMIETGSLDSTDTVTPPLPAGKPE